jgi:hypothetical protein
VAEKDCTKVRLAEKSKATAREKVRERQIIIVAEGGTSKSLWLCKIRKLCFPLGWRTGYGEDYIYRFGDWLDTRLWGQCETYYLQKKAGDILNGILYIEK